MKNFLLASVVCGIVIVPVFGVPPAIAPAPESQPASEALVMDESVSAIPLRSFRSFKTPANVARLGRRQPIMPLTASTTPRCEIP